ncbi:hypothetical protein ACLB2K_057179 [Fragaria x ananassa]
MESFGGLGFSDISSAARRKRSNTSRRPRNEAQLLDYRDISSLSSTPPSDDNVTKTEGGGYVESDEASNNGSFRGSNEHRHTGIDSKRSSKGGLGSANRRGPSKDGSFGIGSDVLENKSTVKKVKLRVGGVTRTIQAKSTSDGASNVGLTSSKSSHISDAPRPRKRSIIQENSDENGSFGSDKGSGLRGVASKDPSKGVFDVGKDNTSRGRIPEEPIRKSKRVPKRRLLDGTVDVGDDDDDVEVRYLEKLKKSKNTPDYSLDYQEDEERAVRKEKRISKVLNGSGAGQYGVDLVDGISKSDKEGKKSRSGRVVDDTDYVEEEEDEPVSDGEPELKIRKNSRKEFADSSSDNKEMTVTTRRRALQTNKDVSSSIGPSTIEFPNGLPPAPPRKQKEELCAVEQQLKKAEAAQRRKMQVEKAARESEAEAIRKILGQDSSRKKKEDKIKKRQEDMAQERAANAMLPSDSVRWVMGPSGSIVTFPDTVGLPTIFDSKPCSYPPPREKCAGPYCTNPYKYRDSQSKLPLCSLQCYKAVHEKMPSLSAC